MAGSPRFPVSIWYNAHDDTHTGDTHEGQQNTENACHEVPEAAEEARQKQGSGETGKEELMLTRLCSYTSPIAKWDGSELLIPTPSTQCWKTQSSGAVLRQ